MQGLRFTFRRDGPTAVVAFHGEVCFSVRPVLEVAADRLRGHTGPVQIDLADVPFLDSSKPS